MSAGPLVRNRSISMSSGHSSRGKLATLAEVSRSMPAQVTRDFEPCAATASMFLYAQGNSVVCCHHDTLTIERRFSRHSEEISLLAVDTVSDRGAGRLVVSYDAGQTAIVWDCMTGDEVARFVSYEPLTVAAWMRNGNVAFGNSQGNVILFEPSTSEHISARTLDQIPITALAPASDCRAYAIGFSNGSLLIATLQPRFTIIHNLSTARGPSPIVTLAWHASSSKSKTDMLASQTSDGDLRVWSVGKGTSSGETAKVVRVLKRSENLQVGPNWLAWSKSGRIIQYSESETSSWDVRTKNVTYESVPTLPNVKGLACYGPGASLFTLGPNNTAQQFDVNLPAALVANVQHPANLLPPSPPVSIEEQKKQNATPPPALADLSSMPINIDISESDEDHMSPLARIAREIDQMELEREEEPDRLGNLSPVSSRSRASTTSRSSAGSRAPRSYQRQPAPAPKPRAPSSYAGRSEVATTMSMGSSIHTREPSVASRDSFSMGSVTSSRVSRSSRRGGSRLRQEIINSPEDQTVRDLFRFTAARLSDIPYSHPQILDNSRLTVDDLRQQMLSTIFGWNGEADTLIQDEIQRYPAGSPQRLLLAKWLGDVDTDILATNTEAMTSSDWMFLALSGIGGTPSQAKIARAYVQRLLEKGDVHTAATILISMGDQNDAIEIYVSHNRHMEALLLTCLVFPADWSRQAELVKKWGAWAVQHGQQQLAIRCFSCTEAESTEPWFSPSAAALTFASQVHQSIPELLSPPLSPPGPSRGPQRGIAKMSSLKLITSFGDKAGKAKFFGLGDDDRTPVGGGVTPIAESALSPQGDTTAFLRPSHRSVLNTPASARTATPGGFARQRLASIGEMPSDVVIPRRHLEPILPTPADSGSDRDRNGELAQARKANLSHPNNAPLNTLKSATYDPIGRAATASPMTERPKYKLQPLPSPSPEAFSRKHSENRTRNGSRDRKPEGLQLHWPPMESVITGDYMTSPDPSVASSRITTASRSVAGSVASSARSPVMSERSYRSAAASPVVTGRSIDPYINSLDAAQYHANKSRARQESRDRHGRARSTSRKPKAREPSQDRMRNDRYIKPAKRSPTSPVPMSPEDLIDLSSGKDVPFSPTESTTTTATAHSRRPRESSRSRAKPTRNPSKTRRSSPDRTPSRATSRARNTSRRPSPEGRLIMIETSGRGRSQGREGSAARSPSSPLPMSPQAKFYQDEDEEDLRRAQEDKMRFRETRSRARSSSRMRDRSTARQESPERRRRDGSSSRRPAERDASRMRKETSPPNAERRPSVSHARSMSQASHARSVSGRDGPDLASQVKDARTLKKEQAARELEERRKSLALRPMAPPIVHPEDIAATLSPTTYRGASEASPDLHRQSPAMKQSQLPPRSQTTSPSRQHRDSSASSVQVGLPATPKAMRHPKYDPDGDIPNVPQIPEKYETSGSGSPPGSNWGSLNAMTAGAYETLGPLPKTTYAAAPRRVPARCASAPIPEEPPLSPNPLPAALPMHPAFQAALPPSARRRGQEQVAQKSPMGSPRKINPGEAQPGTLGYEARNNSPVYSTHQSASMGGIDELMEAPAQNSKDNLIPPPPPPPPAPPCLPQLQHLMTPPPPPPAPLGPSLIPNNTHSMASGVSGGSADIEIVMDNEDEKSKSPHESLAPPQPGFGPSHSRKSSLGHNRGRSEADNSISSRFTRAAERLRSASRGRNSPAMDRNKSPPIEGSFAPYDNVQYENAPPANWGSRRPSISSPSLISNMTSERHPREVKAAMKEMEGGMI
ncbi:hypothetical protein BJ875DRAFT_367229 [Amylocarpus encephaloides]|uniref:Gem-associated protein 5 TPR domain-containing protein n=1 Tax=Amylocarpus encephaloides TaxID=45428 RepID=A0A9P7YS62_9HELO|nr:hypothetical protein BJ875DRAFT_367229 [Amylocarpus encephaloides]